MNSSLVKLAFAAKAVLRAKRAGASVTNGGLRPLLQRENVGANAVSGAVVPGSLGYALARGWHGLKDADFLSQVNDEIYRNMGTDSSALQVQKSNKAINKGIEQIEDRFGTLGFRQRPALEKAYLNGRSSDLQRILGKRLSKAHNKTGIIAAAIAALASGTWAGAASGRRNARIDAQNEKIMESNAAILDR